MNAYANADLKMPAHYVDMSEKEMEYKGGFAWIPICNIISIACTAVSIGCSLAASATGNNTLNKIAGAASLVGAVTGIAGGIGFIGCSTTAAMTSSVFNIGRTALAANSCTFGLAHRLGSGFYNLFR